MKKVVLLFIGIYFFTAANAQESFSSVQLKSISGKMIDISAIVSSSKDTLVVLSFWATWCVPCIHELESINDVFAEKQSIKPFKFLAVSVDDSRTSQRVKPFVSSQGWAFDVLLDINSDLKRSLNVTDIPHVIIIKNNKIVYRHTGYIVGEEDHLFEEISKL